MSKIVIKGGSRLAGTVRIQGSKNSTLPVMAASLLNKGVTIIKNYPDIVDVWGMKEILEYVGCTVIYTKEELIIDSHNAHYTVIPEKLTKKLRASSNFLGPMLGRFGRVKMAPPGGCKIGARPLDIHMYAFNMLGAHTSSNDELISASTTGLIGTEITLRFPSVGATENAIMAAVLAKGDTVIKNASIEPEVMVLCDYLRAAGAEITDNGANEIIVCGNSHLHDVEFTMCSDRIVVGTYVGAVAICQGSVRLTNCSISDLTGYIDIFAEMGVIFECDEEGITVSMYSRPVNPDFIITAPYPGFPTDMQSVVMAVASISQGTLIIGERIFNKRFHTAESLISMGANIMIDMEDSLAVVQGVEKLHGAEVTAKDLRGCAALVLAGIATEGETVINDTDYILRGYVNFVENLRELGADIQWIENKE